MVRKSPAGERVERPVDSLGGDSTANDEPPAPNDVAEHLSRFLAAVDDQGLHITLRERSAIEGAIVALRRVGPAPAS